MLDSSEQVIRAGSGNSIPEPQKDAEPAKRVRLRRRHRKKRRRRVEVFYSDEEYAEVLAGALAAGWSVGGWVAISGLSAARLAQAGPWTAPHD